MSRSTTLSVRPISGECSGSFALTVSTFSLPRAALASFSMSIA